MSFTERFEETVGGAPSGRGGPRRKLVSEIEDVLAGEYPKTDRGRLKVSGVYRLYLDLCHELGREPSMVYTGEGVIHESRLEELAEDSGKSKEELLNELEVEI
jgi:hypothetical protein